MSFLAPIAMYAGGALTGSFAGAAAASSLFSGIGTLGTIGSAVSALGGFASSNAEAKSAEFNARIMQRNSILVQQQAAENARRQRIINEKEQSSIRANTASSGLKLEGSSIDLLGESMVNGELAVRDILNQGLVQSQDFASQASLLKSSAKSTRAGGLLSAGGSLLTSQPILSALRLT
jgi:hypothetical protein